MADHSTSKPERLTSDRRNETHMAVLVLHNDHVNTFDHVMDALVDICGHTRIQAEQCAMLAHYKGKCEVRNGVKDELKEMRYELIARGLKVTIN
ncbi:MAG: ATP-dependent Clp protease adaptor ClpS [Bacteroidota bacterium]